MSLLTSVIPSPYRQFAIAAILPALFFGGAALGFVKGDDYGSAKYVNQMLAESKIAVRVVTEQGKVTTQVVTQYITKLVQVKSNEKEIQDEVPTVLKLDANLMLPASFRLLHDGAADGTIPAAPSGATTSPATAATSAG